MRDGARSAKQEKVVRFLLGWEIDHRSYLSVLSSSSYNSRPFLLISPGVVWCRDGRDDGMRTESRGDLETGAVAWPSSVIC